MSTIFGIVKPAGERVEEADVREMSDRTARYAADGTHIYVATRVGMGRQPYDTHSRAKLDATPVLDRYGNLVVFDGRLDNHHELCASLDTSECERSDSSIILAAYRRWGNECFGKFIGEWALALWSVQESLMYLARDHAGTRTLYFSREGDIVKWSTYLEMLVSSPGSDLDLNREYVRRYIACRPLASLTPYRHVDAVAPAQYIAVGDGRLSKHTYWHCSAGEHIRYRSDTDYADGFVSHFERSVERRTGPGAPIVGQLSGGMDSSSIVCMSDSLRRLKHPSAELIDTVSLIDDTEPGWNEKPFILAVESQRGKTGIHVPMSFSSQTFLPATGMYGSYMLPGADSTAIQMEAALDAAFGGRGYRVILSGVGGDEVLGGPPDPFPELASHLTSGDFHSLFHQAIAWSLVKRTTLINLLSQTVSLTALLYVRPDKAYPMPRPPWIRNGDSCPGGDEDADCPNVRNRLTDSPNDICNRLAWQAAIETLPTLYPDYLSRYEYRYPMLDRELVDYVFSIPRNQLIRPGRRRYLMRNALSGIVPAQVIERKRKGFVIRSPLLALRAAKESGRSSLQGSLAAELGIIDKPKFQEALELTLRGENLKWMQSIARTIRIELWLQAFLTTADGNRPEPSSRVQR